MATRTFSCRADEQSLAFADALARQEYGLSFGQYCGSVLLSYIDSTGRMPSLQAKALGQSKVEAASFIKGFASCATDPHIGRMSDAQLRDLVASRYE